MAAMCTAWLDSKVVSTDARPYQNHALRLCLGSLRTSATSLCVAATIGTETN